MVIRAQFGGANLDLPQLKLPSGTAIALPLNVTIRQGKLAKRTGFGEWQNHVSSTKSILGLFTAGFDNGSIYVIAKISDGATGTLWQRMVYPTDALTFTQITTNHTLSAVDAGWSFMWYDRFYYGDRGGLNKWHPTVNSGVAYKAGLPKPSSGPIATPALLGEKEGIYHCWYAFYNSKTREEGVVSEPSRLTGPTAGPCETRIFDGYGGIGLSSLQALPSAYEADRYRVYSSMGSTEYLQVGANAAEACSWIGYLDVETTVATPAPHTADHVLRTRVRFDNSGGEPPGTRFGCFTGAVAVYAGGNTGAASTLNLFAGTANKGHTYTAKADGVFGNAISITYTAGSGLAVATVATAGVVRITVTYKAAETTVAALVSAVNADATAAAHVGVALNTGHDGSAVVTAVTETYLTGGVDTAANKVLYSKPLFPTMVPKEQQYIYSKLQGGAAVDLVTPQPYIGQIASPVCGQISEVANAGGLVCLFTPTSTWTMRSMGDGRQYLVLAHPGAGCYEHQAACSTGNEVHAFGTNGWTVATSGGIRDIAQDRFRTIFTELMDDGTLGGRMAYFSHLDQVWCAVHDIDDLGNSGRCRILILDRSGGREGEYGALTSFVIAGLAAGEDITAMMELIVPNLAPMMLVATDQGHIYYYDAGHAWGSFADQRTSEAGAEVNTAYSASWYGVFATEGMGRDREISSIEFHTNGAASGGLTAYYRPKLVEADNLSTKVSAQPVSREIGWSTIDPVVGGRVDARAAVIGFYNAAESNAYSMVYDAGTATYALLSASATLTGWANNYQLTADADKEEVNDAAYFGHTVPFPEIVLDFSATTSQAATWSADSAAWEYYNGTAWASLAVKDTTDPTGNDGNRPFQRSGKISFTPPADWCQTTINSQAAWWVRCRIAVAGLATAAICDAYTADKATLGWEVTDLQVRLRTVESRR